MRGSQGWEQGVFGVRVALAQDKAGVHRLPPRQLPRGREAQSGSPRSLLSPRRFPVLGSFQGQRDAPTHARTRTRTRTGTAGHWATFPDRRREWGRPLVPDTPPRAEPGPPPPEGLPPPPCARGWGCGGEGTVTGVACSGRLLFAPRGPQREAGRCRGGRGADEDAAADSGGEPLGCVTEVSAAPGPAGVRAGGAGKAPAAYLFLPSRASTSSSGFSECHWAMGLRGLASMSDQCRSSVPVALLPTKILPMASFLPSLS